MVTAKSAQAATYYWVGGTTNSNTNNPANWNTVQGSCANSANVTVPSTGDSLQFVSNCTNNATVNATLPVATFVMNLGYTGTVNVNGNSLSVATTLTVNNGNLNITNGGSVTSPPGTTSFVIGNVSSSNGTVTVSGSGSQLLQTISGDTRVRLGNASTAVGNLIIQNGATASTGNINAGYAVGGTGNMTVDGVGSVWNSDTNGGLGYIGRQGTATLTISNGGVVNSAAIPWQVGGLAGSTGTVDISGTGSQLNMTGATCNFRLGFSGTGNLNVSSGAVVNVSGTSGKITIADQTGSAGTLTIGSGYTMDQVTTTLGIFTGVGTALFPPIPPSTISSTVTQTSIDWDWNDVSGATGYKVYNASDDTLLATVSTSNWTQSLLTPSVAYSIYIRSTNTQGIGYTSSDASSTTSGTSSNSSTNNSPSQSMPSAPMCTNDRPIGSTDLFQINRKGETATLYFTPVNNHVEGYNVVFGFHEGEEHFGGVEIPVQNENKGVQSMVVRYLDPKVAYYFKVIPINGCAVGEWSNWLNAKGNNSRSVTQKSYRYFKNL